MEMSYLFIVQYGSGWNVASATKELLFNFIYFN